VAKAQVHEELIDRVVASYGDLIFDFCESLLWDPSHAQLAFREILKQLKASRSANAYEEHERAWILRVTCDKLKTYAARHARRLSASEQIQLDSTEGVSLRLKHFEFFFHRLTDEEQILLLLRDKYGLPYPEISAALGLPEGSLKIKRAQALRALEEWLWGTKP
jgi:DNA-directed RNA polymerase specialized sigma24 family protein